MMASTSFNPRASSTFKLNLPLLAVAAVWLVASAYLLFFADLSGLRYGNQEPVTYLLGQLGILPFI